MLAAFDPADYIMHHLVDHPWPGWQVTVWGMRVTLMSSGIAAMIITAVALCTVIVPLARRRTLVPVGGQNVLEAVVVFVRDMIAHPALGDRTYRHLSFLVTLFVFILGMNVMGLVPLEPVFKVVGHWVPALRDKPIGRAATGVGTICMALASVSLVRLVLTGLAAAARRYHHRGWPMWVCVPLSPALWFIGMAPSVPGWTGKILAAPLALLELIGLIGKCAALMVRLLASMTAGHMLLAVLMLFVLQTVDLWITRGAVHVWYVGPLCVLVSAATCLIELLVAVIQAYIFTFLTAMFIGLYAETSH
ncbi:MAG: F0F1 ATP synthase subunit A [Planctomycetota bacterium]